MRLLGVLLRWLPESFRREYGAAIAETVAEKWHDSKGRLGAWGRASFWCKEWISVLRVAWALRRAKASAAPPASERRRPEARLGGTWIDARHALRSLSAKPGFAVVSIVTLGLGVGAATTMFTAVHAILLRPLPYEDPDAIVVIEQVDNRNGSVEDGVSAANLHDIRERSEAFDFAAVAESHGLKLIENGRAVSLRGWLVSEDFLEAMGVEPVLGRGFRPEEFRPGKERVVLLSHESWRARFGADPTIVGRDLVLDGSPYTVIGVLPRGFDYPSAASLWGPRPPQPGDQRTRARARLDAIARLTPGATLEGGQAELDRIASELTRRHPEENRNLGLRATVVREHLLGDVSSPLALLFGAVCLVLLTASANVAGLQVAKGAGRAREYALRGALGASSWRLLRLVIVECGVVSLAGSVIGVALAAIAVSAIRRWGPVDLPRAAELGIDGAVLAFAIGAAVASSVLSGLAPALRASRMEPVRAMVGPAARSAVLRGGRLRDRLVVAQIAAAVVLTIGAGLLVRSLTELSRNDLGFDPTDRFVFQVWAYDDAHGNRLEFFDRAAEAIRALPGIHSVGLTTSLPFADDRSVVARRRSVRFHLANPPASSPDGDRVAGLSVIDEHYPSALGVRLIDGRRFTSEDHRQSRRVAMVNAAFARRHFHRSPVGARITLAERDAGGHEVVGVLADTRREGLESEPEPEIYLALSQVPSNGLTFVVHAEAASGDLIASIQETMWSVDPTQATWAARPLTSLVGDWSRQRRFHTSLLAGFAVLTLCLAAVGVFGLMSFSVEQRVSELGIRRALGGQSSQILRMVLADGLALAAAGAGLGLGAAVVSSRVLENMLFGIESVEPVTYAVLTVFVVIVALVAALVPALRASSVDPLEALRMR